MEKEKLLQIILSPFMCDSVRYLVAIESNYDPQSYFSEPQNSSQLHFVIAIINQFNLKESALLEASQTSKRWRYIYDNFPRLLRIFSDFNHIDRSLAESDYLLVDSMYSFPRSLTA
jgi:hypothetical protein